MSAARTTALPKIKADRRTTGIAAGSFAKFPSLSGQVHHAECEPQNDKPAEGIEKHNFGITCGFCGAWLRRFIGERLQQSFVRSALVRTQRDLCAVWLLFPDAAGRQHVWPSLLPSIRPPATASAAASECNHCLGAAQRLQLTLPLAITPTEPRRPRTQASLEFHSKGGAADHRPVRSWQGVRLARPTPACG